MMCRAFLFNVDKLCEVNSTNVYGHIIDKELLCRLLKIKDGIAGKKFPKTIDIFFGNLDPAFVADVVFSGMECPEYPVDAFLIKCSNEMILNELKADLSQNRPPGYMDYINMSWDKTRQCFYRRSEETAFLSWKFSIKNGVVHPVVTGSSDEDWYTEELDEIAKLGWAVSKKAIADDKE